MQIQSGPNPLLHALQVEDASHQISCETITRDSTVNDVAATVSSWTKSTKRLIVERTLSKVKPQMTIITDSSASAQVTSLWANEEVAKLLSAGQEQEACRLASNYRLVSPVTGAVVLETANDYKAHHLNPGAYKDARGGAPAYIPPATTAPTFGGGGLIGAPVDPRYGQTNEVGTMADFGYDQARDISRIVTLMTLLISIILGTYFLQTRKAVRTTDVYKTVALILGVPTIVHLLGTFMINNFGGLGGGL
jgi:hypothetical protein